MQIDMIDAQLIERPDGSVEIGAQSGYVVFKGEYAKKVKAFHQELRGSYPRTDSLKMVVNIELPQPSGQWVNPG